MVSLAGLSAVPDAYNAAQGDQFQLQQMARQEQAKAVIGKVLQALAMRGGTQSPPVGGMPQGQPPAPQQSPMQGRFADAFAGTPNARPAQVAPQGGGVRMPPALQSAAPGSLTWDNVVNAIARYNPGIAPALLSETVAQFEPLMKADSAEKWKQSDARYRDRALAQRGSKTSTVAQDPYASQYGRPPTGMRWLKGGRLEKIDVVDSKGNPVLKSGTTSNKPTAQQLSNAQLLKVAKSQLPIIVGDGGKNPGTFDSLSSAWNQMASGVGEATGGFVPGNAAVSNDYQQARNALRSIAGGYRYSVSGKAATDKEIRDLLTQVTPVFGDGAPVLKDKKALLKTWVDSIEVASAYLDRGEKPPAWDGGESVGEPPPDEGGDLPPDVTEEDIEFTMKQHGLTREQVLEQLGYDPNGA